MALYRVSVLVRLETYANTEDEAVLQVARAISSTAGWQRRSRGSPSSVHP